MKLVVLGLAGVVRASSVFSIFQETSTAHKNSLCLSGIFGTSLRRFSMCLRVRRIVYHKLVVEVTNSTSLVESAASMITTVPLVRMRAQSRLNAWILFFIPKTKPECQIWGQTNEGQSHIKIKSSNRPFADTVYATQERRGRCIWFIFQL